jgi:hypothetical protein
MATWHGQSSDPSLEFGSPHLVKLTKLIWFESVRALADISMDTRPRGLRTSQWSGAVSDHPCKGMTRAETAASSEWPSISRRIARRRRCGRWSITGLSPLSRPRWTSGMGCRPRRGSTTTYRCRSAIDGAHGPRSATDGNRSLLRPVRPGTDVAHASVPVRRPSSPHCPIDAAKVLLRRSQDPGADLVGLSSRSDRTIHRIKEPYSAANACRNSGFSPETSCM